MNNGRNQQAISAALAGNWNEAVRLNEDILSDTPDDTDALNRLARAYAELGNVAKARKTASHVLQVDPFNSIAKKSLEKWKNLKKTDAKIGNSLKPSSFLEEPGKTKIVGLMHLGAAGIIADLDSGDEVKLNPQHHRICVTSMEGKYIGRLPDDLSARIKQLISHGNEYIILIKSTGPEGVKVFIRESVRADKLKDIPSFPAEKDRIEYISFTPPELVYDKDDMSHAMIGEEAEE